MDHMKGKICLITGATNGIGLVTAEALAAAGTRLVLVGRDAARTAGVADRLRAETGNDTIESLCADLSVQAEVRGLADAFRARHDRLDVLINNAGAIFAERQVTSDGLEMTFALNHMNYFLLTNLLVDALRASAPARIVNVSSRAHLGVALDFDDLQAERRYNGWLVYKRSKLANLLFTAALGRRLDGSGVTVNALHPGFVATRFGHNNRSALGYGLRFAQLAAISPAKGAETTIYLATTPEVEGISGRYFHRKRPVEPSAAARDHAAAERLWEISAELTET